MRKELEFENLEEMMLDLTYDDPIYGSVQKVFFNDGLYLVEKIQSTPVQCPHCGGEL